MGSLPPAQQGAPTSVGPGAFGRQPQTDTSVIRREDLRRCGKDRRQLRTDTSVLRREDLRGGGADCGRARGHEGSLRSEAAQRGEVKSLALSRPSPSPWMRRLRWSDVPDRISRCRHVGVVKLFLLPRLPKCRKRHLLSIDYTVHHRFSLKGRPRGCLPSGRNTRRYSNPHPATPPRAPPPVEKYTALVYFAFTGCILLFC